MVIVSGFSRYKTQVEDCRQLNAENSMTSLTELPPATPSDTFLSLLHFLSGMLTKTCRAGTLLRKG